MSRELHAALVIAVCALVTLALRALPFVCFGGKHGIPRRIVRLGSALPPAIMAAFRAASCQSTLSSSQRCPRTPTNRDTVTNSSPRTHAPADATETGLG